MTDNTNDINLREKFAADRTALANERTLLAYIRTALTFFIAGVTFVKFFGSFIIELLGWIFIPAGILFFIIGFIRYKKVKNIIINSNTKTCQKK